MMTRWFESNLLLILAEQAGIGSFARAVQDATPLLPWIGAALASGVAMVVATRWAQAGMDRLREAPFVAALLDTMGFTPGTTGDPAARARLDDLRRRFSEGVDTFRRAGKDISSLPWYLLVGPPGAGKTEAIRRSKLSFPPGLHDFYQGAGGTLNMHWWFTNHAVVLDTAGRVFMEQPVARTRSEWRSFLSLLRRHRPSAPINGVVLVLGVDTLLAGRDEEIEANANQIARQIQTISTELGIRVPAYLLVTKCDLIPGFATSFDNLDDADQQQMLGWSCPHPIDEPFRGDLMDQIMREIRVCIERRRLSAIAGSRDAAPRSPSEHAADEIYTLPAAVAQLAAPLKRSLEIIFQDGPWSPRPPLLRGVYLTSSMRKGQTLDRELALALGAPIGQIPGGKVWASEQSLFLRDVFERKIFAERGLVTSAAESPRRETIRRRGLLALAAAVSIAALGGASILGARHRHALSEPAAFWRDVRENMLSGRSALITGFASPVFAGEERDARALGRTLSRAELFALVREHASPPHVPDALRARIADAADAYTISSLLKPLIERAVARFASESAPSPKATRALAQLLALDVRGSGLVPEDGPPTDLACVFEALFEGHPDAPTREQFARLVSAAENVRPEALAAAGILATDASRAQLESAIDHHAASWQGRLQPDHALHGRSIVAIERVRQVSERHAQLRRRLDAIVSADAFASSAPRYAEEVAQYDELVASWPSDTLGLLRESIASPPDVRAIVEASRQSLAAEHRVLRGALPTAPGQYASMADTLREALADATDSIETRITESIRSLADPTLQAFAGRPRGSAAPSLAHALLAAHLATAAAVRDTFVAIDALDPASWRTAPTRYAALDQRWSQAADLWIDEVAASDDATGSAGLVDRIRRCAIASAANADLARLRSQIDSAGGIDALLSSWKNDAAAPGVPFESREELALSSSARAALVVLSRLESARRPSDLLAWARDAAESITSGSPCFGQEVPPWRDWEQFRQGWARLRVVPSAVNVMLAQRLATRAEEAELLARVLDDPWLSAWAAECRERAAVARSAAEPGSTGAILLAAFTDRLAQLASLPADEARKQILEWAAVNTFDAEYAAPFDPSVPDYWRSLARSCLGALADGSTAPGPEVAAIRASLGPPVLPSGVRIDRTALPEIKSRIERLTLPDAGVSTRVAPLAGPLARLAANTPLGDQAWMFDDVRAAAAALSRSPFATIEPITAGEAPMSVRLRVSPAVITDHTARPRVELTDAGVVIDRLELPPIFELIRDRRALPHAPTAGFARSFTLATRLPTDGRTVLLRVVLSDDWPLRGGAP